MNSIDLQEIYDNCACFKFRALSRKLSREYDEALKPVGVKTTQFTLLSVIKGYRPSSVTKLAESLEMERTSLVRTLKVLNDHGWIDVDGEGYRREKKITITEEGENILALAFPLWQEAQRRFENEISKDVWDKNKLWLNSLSTKG